jgi:hypothetical protein
MSSTFESSGGKCGKRIIVSVALIPTPTTSINDEECAGMNRLSAGVARSASNFRTIRSRRMATDNN